MNRYSIYCTSKQTMLAIKLGAPLKFIPMFRYGDDSLPKFIDRNRWDPDEFCYCPTAEQMIGWLEDQNIWIHFCKPNQRPNLLSYSICHMNPPFKCIKVGGEYSSHREATIAAIDDALDYLTNSK